MGDPTHASVCRASHALPPEPQFFASLVCTRRKVLHCPEEVTLEPPELRQDSSCRPTNLNAAVLVGTLLYALVFSSINQSINQGIVEDIHSIYSRHYGVFDTLLQVQGFGNKVWQLIYMSVHLSENILVASTNFHPHCLLEFCHYVGNFTRRRHHVDSFCRL